MTIFYPDIASFQAGIRLGGALAVCAKVTEGTGYVNPSYAAFQADAASHGVFFSAYHFLLQGNAAAQAGYAYRHAGGVPLMLDVEPEEGAGSFPTLADAVAFIDAYRKAGGTCWLLYLPRWYWQDLGSPSLKPFTDRGMLLVSSDYTTYTDADSGAGWQPYGGMTPTVWQYTSTVAFGGIADVDFNAFRGSKYAGRQDPASVTACLAEFRSLVTTGKYPQPKPADWRYGPPQNLTVRPGDASVLVERCDPPAGAPVPPDHYEISVFTGSYPSPGTLVDSYPRYMRAAPGQFGSLQDIPAGMHMTLRAVAYGPDGSHAGSYADVHFVMP